MVIKFPLEKRGLVECEITGIWYNPADFPAPATEYWVVEKTAEAHEVGKAFAMFDNYSDAAEYILAEGLGAVAKIVELM